MWGGGTVRVTSFPSTEPQVEVFQVPMTSKLETRKIALGSQIRKYD